VRPATTLLLARPTSAADRGRFLLVTGATAVAGGLLVAAARVAQLTIDTDGGGSYLGPQAPVPDGGLAPYVSQAGLRPGVVLGAVLLTVPVLALAVQALRVGSVARERRMASLRLAGATPREVRTIAAAEAGAAAAMGGLLAGPVYLVLWLLLGVLLPVGLRLVPTPATLDLVTWAGVLLVASVGGAAAGAVVQGRVVAEPLGVRRRSGPRPPGGANLLGLLGGLALVVGGAVPLTHAGSGEYVLFALVIAGLLFMAFTAGPRLVRRRGRTLQRRGSAVDLLAGGRLRAEPRAPGRVAAVLVVCGIALGVEAVQVTHLLTTDGNYDLSFYLTGFGMAAVGVLVAVVVAVLTLLVGAADQLLDARRPLASLFALGVDESTLARVLQRQQSAAAVPAVAIGALVGGAGTGYLASGDGPARIVLPTLAVAALAAAAVWLVTRLAARLLRSRLRSTLDPENLRVA
jgi:hypothetical protein